MPDDSPVKKKTILIKSVHSKHRSLESANDSAAAKPKPKIKITLKKPLIQTKKKYTPDTLHVKPESSVPKTTTDRFPADQKRKETEKPKGKSHSSFEKKPFQPRDTKPGGTPSFDNKHGSSRSDKKDKNTNAPVVFSKKSYKTTRKKVFINKKKQDKEKHLQFISKKKGAITNPVPKKIKIMETITIAELAKKMNLKASDILSKLMTMGTMTSINAAIDYETAQLLASEYGCEVELISLFDQTIVEDVVPENDELVPRPPIVTIMGHVDHGKTTILDLLRNSKVAENEQGNITQHIGAYQVSHKDKYITFLDTPGHYAFSQIRSRGAKITDIIVLVVAIDDGVMPQTVEAIKLAHESKTPIVIALNKVDLSDHSEEKVLQALNQHEILPEEWGGDVPICKVSALENQGIDNLLENIVLQAEVLDLKASSVALAKGTVLESRVEMGRGIVITVLIQNGTLKVGAPFLSGIYYGKVRAIYNDLGKSIKSAGPGTPVEVVGLEDAPAAGDPFQVTENEKIAKQVSVKRKELDRLRASENITKVTSETLYSSIQAKQIDTYNVIIKGDVHGSVEAIKTALLQLGNDEVKARVIQASTGSINENDVMLASTSSAEIISFNIRPVSKITKLANQEKVQINRFSLIFDIIDYVKERLNERLKPDIVEEQTAEVEVRNVFKITKVGTIAGSYVRQGTVQKNFIAKVFRKEAEIFSGTITSLKRIKDDVSMVEGGVECGIGVDNFNDFQVGDIIRVYKEKTITRTL